MDCTSIDNNCSDCPRMEIDCLGPHEPLRGREGEGYKCDGVALARGVGGRGTCPVCYRNVSMRDNHHLWRHKMGGSDEWCEGSSPLISQI